MTKITLFLICLLFLHQATSACDCTSDTDGLVCCQVEDSGGPNSYTYTDYDCATWAECDKCGTSGTSVNYVISTGSCSPSNSPTREPIGCDSTCGNDADGEACCEYEDSLGEVTFTSFDCATYADCMKCGTTGTTADSYWVLPGTCPTPSPTPDPTACSCDNTDDPYCCIGYSSSGGDTVYQDYDCYSEARCNCKDDTLANNIAYEAGLCSEWTDDPTAEPTQAPTECACDTNDDVVCCMTQDGSATTTFTQWDCEADANCNRCGVTNSDAYEIGVGDCSEFTSSPTAPTEPTARPSPEPTSCTCDNADDPYCCMWYDTSSGSAVPYSAYECLSAAECGCKSDDGSVEMYFQSGNCPTPAPTHEPTIPTSAPTGEPTRCDCDNDDDVTYCCSSSEYDSSSATYVTTLSTYDCLSLAKCECKSDAVNSVQRYYEEGGCPTSAPTHEPSQPTREPTREPTRCDCDNDDDVTYCCVYDSTTGSNVVEYVEYDCLSSAECECKTSDGAQYYRGDCPTTTTTNDPTNAPVTEAPATVPTAKVPTEAPPTEAPPTAKVPTATVPTDASPTARAPTVKVPTEDPTAKVPTEDPTVKVPTEAPPTTKYPTNAPITDTPTNTPTCECDDSTSDDDDVCCIGLTTETDAAGVVSYTYTYTDFECEEEANCKCSDAGYDDYKISDEPCPTPAPTLTTDWICRIYIKFVFELEPEDDDKDVIGGTCTTALSNKGDDTVRRRLAVTDGSYAFEWDATAMQLEIAIKIVTDDQDSAERIQAYVGDTDFGDDIIDRVEAAVDGLDVVSASGTITIGQSPTTSAPARSSDTVSFSIFYAVAVVYFVVFVLF